MDVTLYNPELFIILFSKLFIELVKVTYFKLLIFSKDNSLEVNSCSLL